MKYNDQLKCYLKYFNIIVTIVKVLQSQLV